MKKQKAEIKLAFKNEKQRLKALKVVTSAHKSCSKITSIGWKGNSEDVIEVVGDGVDIIKLVESLRKKLDGAHIITLATVADEKKADDKFPVLPLPPPWWYPYEHVCVLCDGPSYRDHSICSVM